MPLPHSPAPVTLPQPEFDGGEETRGWLEQEDGDK